MSFLWRPRATAMLCILVFSTGSAEADELIEPVFAAAESNVVFSDLGSGFVQISFTGEFDFSAIGGSLEPYTGTFTYDTSIPPASTPPDPNVDIAFYEPETVDFSIFGGLVDPLHVSVLIQDGDGIFNDFFTFQVTLDVNQGPGLPIPDTGYGLVAIGLNAGAFPGVMFTSISMPTDLDIFASATGSGDPTQFAVVVIADGDGDGDGISDSEDNCPDLPNGDQANFDGDALGDVCDSDDDNDGQDDADELACGSDPFDTESRSADFDGDGILDCLDPDDDNDLVSDGADECPDTVIPEAAPTSPLGLNRNRWALMRADGVFTQAPPQERSTFYITTAQTRGCSCEQIVDERGVGKAHLSRGCSSGLVLSWINNP